MAGKTTTGINVGGSSILVIFIILCLTTFATLSMVSAQADLRLTEKAAAATAEFYAADAQAERILADIDRALPASGAIADSKTAIEGAVEGVAVAVVGADALSARYTVQAGETQELVVELEIRPALTGGDRITRRVWQTVPVGEWEPEPEGFTLWQGDDFIIVDDDPAIPIG